MPTVEQHLALNAIAALQEDRAPAALRIRMQLLGTLAQRRRAAVRRRALAAAAAGLAIAALAAPALILTGSAAAPSVADAVTLASKPEVSRVPEPPEGRVTLPGVSAAGLVFPYWEGRFGWKATGMRRDRVHGRVLTTVLYARGPRTVAYTVVSGPATEQPAAARAAARAGTRLNSLSLAGRNVVTWRRRGHTCVLSARDVPTNELLVLGAWRARGAIPY